MPIQQHLLNHRVIALVSVMTISTMLLGCSKRNLDADMAPIDRSGSMARIPTFDEASVDRSDKPTQGMTASEKIQDYVACYNSLNSNVHDTINSYTRWLKNAAAGPSGKEKTVGGIELLDSERVAQCEKSLAHVATQRPVMIELDAAGQAYMTALKAMDMLVTEAHAYYKSGTYKTDKFEKGRTLHKPLINSFTSFEQANTALTNALELQNDIVLNEQLREIASTKGKHIEYWQLALMQKAKLLAHTVGAATFDTRIATIQLASYERVADDTLAYTKVNTKQASPKWTILTQASTELRIAAQERIRRVKEKTPYTPAESKLLKGASASKVKGSAPAFIKAYNDMVEANNNL